MLFSAHDSKAVEIKDGIHPKLAVRPMYYILGFSDTPRMFTRRVVLDKLLKAVRYLPDQMGFMVWDVYRCRSCQDKLFKWMRGEIKKKYPQLADAENYKTAKKFMSPPSKVGDAYCPPHLSGGAVDLTLFDISTWQELDMGTPFDDCTERARSDYFDKYLPQSNNEMLVAERRKMLSSVMQKVGFSVYEYEWWHFDIGNVFWSRKFEIPEAFGPLFGDLELPECFP